MPVAKSLKKVEQKLKSGAVHPKARKFQQLNRASLRETKLSKRKMERGLARDAQLLRMKFIRAAIDRDENKSKAVFTDSEIQEFISEFISRDDAELQQMRSARRPGRPTSTRYDALQTRREFESHEFDTGFYIVTLTDPDNVKKFREWNQEYSGIGLLKFERRERRK